MNDIKITVTFEGGKRRVLKARDTLRTIDARRTAYFVFNNGQVFAGHSDGEVDEDGDFYITAGSGGLVARGGLAMPFGRLIGWAYVNPQRAKR